MKNTLPAFSTSPNPLVFVGITPISCGGTRCAARISSRLAFLIFKNSSLAAVPSGCLAFNGQAFNKTTYPILAQKYPSGVLPDLRGEFIRGWDNGRGVDSGRGLLGAQAGSLLFGLDDNSAGGDAFVITNNNRNNTGWDAPQISDYKITSPQSNIGFIASLYSGINTANGMYSGFSSGIGVARPRNIAFQYICLAA